MDNRDRYIIDTEFFPEPWVLEQDPLGSDQTEIEIGRAKLTYGMFGTIANNLQFPMPLKDKLEEIVQEYGIDVDIWLTKLSKHPITDDWTLIYTGKLDVKGRRIENNIFSCDYIEGGLSEILDSQKKEKFEIDRKTDIYNKPITELHPDRLDLKEGRKIYLFSKLNTNENFTAHSGVWRPNSYEYREGFRPFPLNVITNNDPLNIQPPFETLGIDERWDKRLQNMFFATADRDRGTTKLNTKIKFRVEASQGKNSRNEFFKVVLDRYDENLNLIDRDILGDYGHPLNYVGDVIDIPEFEKVFSIANGNEIKEGESFALGILVGGEFTGNFTSEGYLKVFFDQVDIKMDWAEDSYFRPTTTKVVTAFNTGQRITEIITGKPAFKSKTLSEGKWKDLLFTVGFWLRNMDEVEATEDRDNEERTLAISWDDFHNSLNALEPMAYGIVTQGAKQFIAYENRSYFFQPYVTVELGQPSGEIKRYGATDLIYSHVRTGYTKGGNYERPLGLDEPNIETNYVLPITKHSNKYEAVSPSRADANAIEDVRRKQGVDFPEEDTSYDKDVFMIHGKKTGEVRGRYDLYDLRHWQDDFEQAPTGIYDPASAFNLTMSPANNRNEHAIWFNSATVKYPDRYMVYANTEGNVQLTTKYPGKDPVYERGDVQIKELKKPIHAYDWIEFDYPFSQELLNKIQGQTLIDGELVNNWYGWFEFINEKGRKERGFLFSVKIKQNNMKFKLLKAY